MAGILSILGMVLKFLPYIVPILGGFFNALGKLNTAQEKEGTATIDLEKLQEFIEEQTTTYIHDVVEKHKSRLVTYVPNEEQAARDLRMDELLAELERAQAEYEESRTTPPQEKSGEQELLP